MFEDGGRNWDSLSSLDRQQQQTPATCCESDSAASASRVSTSLVYYGLSLSVGSFGMDVYITQLIFGAVEIPGSLLSLTLNQRMGRRPTQAFSLIFAGVACLSILAVPRGSLPTLPRACVLIHPASFEPVQERNPVLPPNYCVHWVALVVHQRSCARLCKGKNPKS